MKKEYFIDDKKIEVFLIKTNNYSELRFFVEGSLKYAVSDSSYENIVNSIEHAIKTFNESFFHKDTIEAKTTEVDLHNKVKSLGFN